MAGTMAEGALASPRSGSERIAGLWVFHEAALQFGRAGRTLTLVSPPPSAPRMLALLGWSEIASLRVQE
jgi:hypothetical protein